MLLQLLKAFEAPASSSLVVQVEHRTENILVSLPYDQNLGVRTVRIVNSIVEVGGCYLKWQRARSMPYTEVPLLIQSMIMSRGYATCVPLTRFRPLIALAMMFDFSCLSLSTRDSWLKDWIAVGFLQVSPKEAYSWRQAGCISCCRQIDSGRTSCSHGCRQILKYTWSKLVSRSQTAFISPRQASPIKASLSPQIIPRLSLKYEYLNPWRCWKEPWHMPSH